MVATCLLRELSASDETLRSVAALLLCQRFVWKKIQSFFPLSSAAALLPLWATHFANASLVAAAITAIESRPSNRPIHPLSSLGLHLRSASPSPISSIILPGPPPLLPVPPSPFHFLCEPCVSSHPTQIFGSPSWSSSSVGLAEHKLWLCVVPSTTHEPKLFFLIGEAPGATAFMNPRSLVHPSIHDLSSLWARLWKVRLSPKLLLLLQLLSLSANPTSCPVALLQLILALSGQIIVDRQSADNHLL